MKKQKANLTHDTVPATVGLVKAVRDELRADIRAVEHGLSAKIEAVDSKVDVVISRMDMVDSRLGAVNSKIEAVENGLNSKIDQVERGLSSRIDQVEQGLNSKIEQVERGLNSKIEQVERGLSSKIEQVEHRLSSEIKLVMVSVHRTQVLMEEQRGENRIVLDGIKTVIERQDRIETDFHELRNTVLTISAGAKR